MTPRLLDLFCCEGGAGMGYHLAGFEVAGVDKDPQPRYPFEHHVADALEFLAEHWHEFDAIHASPPCQSESDLRFRTGKEYDDLLTPTLAALADIPRAWVVENVASTDKLPGSLVLCGTEFGLGAVDKGRFRHLKRHRRFASNVLLMGAGGCHCHGRRIGGVYGNGGGGEMARGFKFSLGPAREAMQMPWASRRGVSQGIPPAMTRFIGEQLMAALPAAVAR